MKGKLIVIDGLDASGKETQCKLLYDELSKRGEKVKHISFPDYNDASSALVKMYLGGEFGNDPSSVNPYAASSFYAVDRVASYLRFWREFYHDGGIIIADRYTTSNAIHQAVKIEKSGRKSFFKWLYEYEFDLLGLPEPDLVVFLDVPPKISQKLIRNRNNKIDGSKEKDIHEKAKQYLIDCYDCAREAAKFLGWTVIKCTDGCDLRTIDDISREVIRVADNGIKE